MVVNERRWVPTSFLPTFQFLSSNCFVSYIYTHTLRASILFCISFISLLCLLNLAQWAWNINPKADILQTLSTFFSIIICTSSFDFREQTSTIAKAAEKSRCKRRKEYSPLTLFNVALLSRFCIFPFCVTSGLEDDKGMIEQRSSLSRRRDDTRRLFALWRSQWKCILIIRKLVDLSMDYWRINWGTQCSERISLIYGM